MPYIWMFNLEKLHVSKISWPKTLVFNAVKSEEKLTKTFSSAQMEIEIAALNSCQKGKNRLNSVKIVRQRKEHGIL